MDTVDFASIIQKYCGENKALYEILWTHSMAVANRALKICKLHPELELNCQFLKEASMLHDIGIVLADAPGIECYGTEPYIRHGLLGAEILRAEGLEAHARVAERHTGTGLTVDQITRQQLPLPARDFSPETLEEQVICYADKFYSKSHLEREKTPEQVLRSLEKFGDEGVERFRRWMEMFE